MLADSVGLALLVVLETLTPAERLAFVLHDMFSVPSARSARSWADRPRPRDSSPAGPAAASAGRLRSRTPTCGVSARSSTRTSRPHVKGASRTWSPCSTPTSCCARTRRGDRAEDRPRGRAVASAGGHATRRGPYFAQPALVNGVAGFVVVGDGAPTTVAALTVVDGRVVEMDILADPERLAKLDLSEFGAVAVVAGGTSTALGGGVGVRWRW